jgi:hypothetical protein
MRLFILCGPCAEVAEYDYIYVMGETRVPGFRHLYDLCHIPLDNNLMAALREYGFACSGCWRSHSLSG